MEGAEGGVTVVEGTGGEAERGGRAARRRFGAAAVLLAPGEVAAGREAEPGGEVFFRRPPSHVDSDLADDGEGGGCVNAVELGEVDPGEAMQVLAGIEAEGRASSLAPPACVGPGRRAGPVREPRELRLDRTVARRDLRLVELEQFYRLPQLEQVLCSPGALQRAGDGLRVRLAVG